MTYERDVFPFLEASYMPSWSTIQFRCTKMGSNFLLIFYTINMGCSIIKWNKWNKWQNFVYLKILNFLCWRHDLEAKTLHCRFVVAFCFPFSRYCYRCSLRKPIDTHWYKNIFPELLSLHLCRFSFHIMMKFYKETHSA